MKQIIIWSVSIILFLILGFCVIWTVTNFSKVQGAIGGTNIYDATDLDNAYKDGYDTALDNEQEYIAQTESLRNQITELQFEILERIDIINKAKETLLASELSNESKQQLINELNNNIFNLNIYIDELNKMVLTLKDEKFIMEQTIAQLQEQRANLLVTINAYEQLIASLEAIKDRFVVTFMFDNSVYSIVLVPNDDMVDIVNPTNTQYTIFLGWSLIQDGELVDLNTYQINADTVFYAKIIRKYDVNFILDYNIFQHHIVERNDTITATIPPSTSRRVFKGWSLDGVNVIDITNYPITEHRNFFAVVETRYEVKFVYTRSSTGQTTTLATLYVPSGRVNAPSTPTFNGYTFNGWLLNGATSVDPNAYNITSDTVFVAKYVSITGNISYSYRFGTNGLYGQYSILQYLQSNGYGYVNNMQMIKSFTVGVRVFAGNVNGTTYTLSQNNFSVYRVPCASFSEFLATGTLYYSVGLLSNGYLQMQMSFEGSSLISSNIFSGSLEIIGMSFQLVDF